MLKYQKNYNLFMHKHSLSHSVTPFFAGGLNLQPNVQNGRGAWQDLKFWRGVAGKKEDDFFQWS